MLRPYSMRPLRSFDVAQDRPFRLNFLDPYTPSSFRALYALRLIHFLCQLSLLQVPLRARPFGGARVVGDHKNSLVKLAIEPVHEIEHFFRRYLIEIARRLVGDEDCWIRRDGSGNRHTLLLPAGDLARIMMLAVCESDHFQGGLGVAASFLL